MYCIKNGLIHDADKEEPYVADILVEEGKIKAIGCGLSIPEDAKIIDVEGLQVYPGVCGSALPSGTGRIRYRL